MRLEEPKPISIKQGAIPLRIESYELYQMIARTTIDQLQMKKSKDPNAGLPIIGSAAARALDPVRNRQVIQASKSQARIAGKQTAGKEADKSRSRSSGLNVASDPPADAGQGT